MADQIIPIFTPTSLHVSYKYCCLFLCRNIDFHAGSAPVSLLHSVVQCSQPVPGTPAKILSAFAAFILAEAARITTVENVTINSPENRGG